MAGTISQLMSILDDPNNSNFDSVATNPDKLVEALLRPRLTKIKLRMRSGSPSSKRWCRKARISSG